MLLPLGTAAALAFVIIGILNVPLQCWLFLRDMRMKTTEYKREHKDLEGDPMIRHEQQWQRREAVMQPAKLGVKNAVIVFTAGDRAVALRYVKGETPCRRSSAKVRAVWPTTFSHRHVQQAFPWWWMRLWPNHCSRLPTPDSISARNCFHPSFAISSDMASLEVVV
ncbi:EscU/YscU/HrcU family type III secretion system export apparatus switch protein [Mesorhizobium sp. DCY119]|uniref:EscU/YscU/HrcU family type III secretion system export apparatus switch protein n=1 Tax=Mesorhizobium sp. DCY119 TaxID=2108445 RepID=UPI000E71B96C|nr:EscU/YscU/HrcU family type III secretion system export apparatus switch protein [Mesorhizobium sp. DCY119]RJG41507.1 hypothetical protein D3Y55_30635 [Mesorhizobium sp. DCY119]